MGRLPVLSVALAALLAAWSAAAAPAAVSADGRRLAFAVDVPKAAVVVRELVTDRFLVKAEIGPRAASEMFWAGPSGVVLLSPLRSSDPRRLVQLVDVEARTLRLVQADDRTALFESAVVREAGGAPVLALVGQGPSGLSLYTTAADGSRVRLAAAGTLQTVGWVAGPDGAPVAEARLDRRKGRWTLRVWTEGAWREAAGLSARGEPRLLGLGADGLGVLYAVRTANGWTWREARLDGRPPGAPLPVGARDTPILDPLGGRIIGRVIAAGEAAGWDFFKEADAQAWRQVMETFSDARVSLLSWDEGRHHILARVERKGRRPGVALVNLLSREATWIDGR